jgi:hypothetical protein
VSNTVTTFGFRISNLIITNGVNRSNPTARSRIRDEFRSMDQIPMWINKGGCIEGVLLCSEIYEGSDNLHRTIPIHTACDVSISIKPN